MHKTRFAKHIVRWMFLGVAIGIVLAAIGFFSRVKASFLADSFPADLSVFEWLWVGLNFPARLLFRLWVLGLRLPPQNDVLVFLLLPSVAVLIQWTLLGFLAGLWRCRKLRGNAAWKKGHPLRRVSIR